MLFILSVLSILSIRSILSVLTILTIPLYALTPQPSTLNRPSPSNVSNRYCHTSVCRKGHGFDDHAEEKTFFC